VKEHRSLLPVLPEFEIDSHLRHAPPLKLPPKGETNLLELQGLPVAAEASAKFIVATLALGHGGATAQSQGVHIFVQGADLVHT
jgi:hypothetical protein